MKNLRIYILATSMLVAGLSGSASDIRGDLNDDGTLTLADVKELSDILLGVTSSTLPNDQLDFNSDGTVNIGDLTKLIDIVVNSKEGGLDVGIDGWKDTGEDYGGTLTAPARSSNELWVECPEASISCGEHYSLPVVLNNSVSVNAFLMTILLPDGLEFDNVNFSYCTLSRNASTHVVDAYINDGNLRVIAYSTSNTPFTGEEGDILYVNVISNEDKAFSLGITDAEFSDTNFCTLYAEDVAGLPYISLDSLFEESIDGACYDIMGRKISNPSHGIYIVKGKKIFFN